MTILIEILLTDYLPNLVAGLFALFLGIPFGLWLDRLVQKRNMKELKTVLFIALKEETLFNIRQMMSFLVAIDSGGKKFGVPVIYLSSSVWGSVINGQQIDALGNTKTLGLSLYLYRIVDRIKINMDRARLLTYQEDSINGQVNLDILQKMVTSSVREGLEIALMLLNNLDEQVGKEKTIVPGVTELLSAWEKRDES